MLQLGNKGYTKNPWNHAAVNTMIPEVFGGDKV